MKDLQKVYESKRERMNAATQQIVVELNKVTDKGFGIEYIITDCPASMVSISEEIKGWDKINAKVQKLISDGLVADIYLDYQ